MPPQKASNTTTDTKPKLTIIIEEENNTKNLHTASASIIEMNAREDTESTQEDEDPSPCLKPGSQRSLPDNRGCTKNGGAVKLPKCCHHQPQATKSLHESLSGHKNKMPDTRLWQGKEQDDPPDLKEQAKT